jgi:hypothetical protein
MLYPIGKILWLQVVKRLGTQGRLTPARLVEM